MANQLREHQLALLNMLHVIDDICCRHNIRYSLFAGSALGAVRHHGFIPWDDDLDIIMLRKDYETFMQIAPAELDTDQYYLQREFSDHWPMFFSKLRKNGTACMEKYHPRDREMHQGIYIDIFPCDNLSDSRLVSKLQFYASKVIIAKSLDRRGYLTDSKTKKIFIAVCRLLPKAPFLRFVKDEKAVESANVHVFLGAASKYERSVFPREWINQVQRCQFEDGQFPIPAHYEKLLTRLYGDYMQLPPEEERECKEHSMLTDLSQSYENYIDWQMQQKITVFTRSIR